MAGPNVIEYEFQGKTIGLEKALNTIKSNIYEVGSAIAKVTSEAEKDTMSRSYETVKNLQKTLDEASAKIAKGEEVDVKAVVKAGTEALRISTQLHNKVLKLHDREQKQKEKLFQNETKAKEREAAKQQKLAEKEKLKAEKVEDVTSVSGVTMAGAQATYIKGMLLGKYGNQLSLLPGGEDTATYMRELISQFEEQRKGFEEGTVSGEEFAETILEVGEAYNDAYNFSKIFAKELSNAKNRVVEANDLIVSSLTRVQAKLQSTEFYLSAFKTAINFVVNFIKESITSYADYAEAVNKIEVVTAEATENLKDFATALALTYGFSLTDIYDATASYYSFAQALNMSSTEATKLSKKMMSLTVDWASLMNMTNEEAATKLQSALAGRTQSMNFYGAVVSDANVQEWLLNKGIQKNFKSMNEASQAYARYLYLVETLSPAQDDLENTIESTANQLRIFNDQIENLKTNVGSLNDEALSPFVRLLNDILQPVNSFLSGINAAKTATESAESIEEESEAVDDLAESIEDANGLAGIDEINQMSASDTSTEGVDDDLVELGEDVEEAEYGFNALYEAGEKFGTAFESLPEWVQWIGKLIAGVTGIASALGVAYLSFVALQKIVFPFIGKSIAKIKELTLEYEQNTAAKTKNTTATTKGTTAEATNTTAVKAETTAEAENSTANTTNAVTEATEATAKDASTSASKKQYVAAKLEVAGDRQVAASSAATVAPNLAQATSSVAASGPAAPATALLILTGLSLLAGVGTMVAGIVSSAKSDIPGAAKGGTVTGPTLALIGEGKYDEAVVPLGNSPQFTSMKEDIASEVLSKLNTSTRSSNTPVVLNINGRELARAILPDLSITRPQTGVKLS